MSATSSPMPSTPADDTASNHHLAITGRLIDELKPYAGNPRTHSKLQVRQIANSIRTFGFTNPVLIDQADRIVAGHGRVLAAKLLGLSAVPTIRLQDLTDGQIRAYVLADNKLAENAGWDVQLLAIELQGLLELDLDFDVSVTGFEAPEIDIILEEARDRELDPKANAVPAIDPTIPAVTQPGDLWILGEHRLLCADATSAQAYSRLMDGAKAQMVITDPPYNVRIDGNVGGLGSVHHRDFAMATGEMSEAEFIAFLDRVMGQLNRVSQDGALHFMFMDWRHLYELFAAGRQHYAELKNLCVWNKTNGGMGSFYRSKHELIAVFKVGTAVHINNIELGRHGRYRTNVWDYAGVNSLRAGRMDELAMHPTVKPVELVADAILDVSRRRGIVLDAFAGSGTTIIAAERTHRRAFAIEIDPLYVDTAIQRWQAYAGELARHSESGLPFDAMSDQRTACTAASSSSN